MCLTRSGGRSYYAYYALCILENANFTPQAGGTDAKEENQFNCDRNTGQKSRPLPTSPNYSRDTTEVSIVGKHQKQAQASLDLSGEKNESSDFYQTVIAGQQNQQNVASPADETSHHPNATKKATNKYLKPAILPKPIITNPKRVPLNEKTTVTAELKSAADEGKRSLAHSNGGYDNDSAITPPLPKPNLPKRNPRLQLEDTQQIYQNQ